MKSSYQRAKQRIFQVLEKGEKGDLASIICDGLLTALILINVVSVFMETFRISPATRRLLALIETVSVIIFTAEYLLRLWSATCIYPGAGRIKARVCYVFSGMALIDLLAILPFYLTFSPWICGYSVSCACSACLGF